MAATISNRVIPSDDTATRELLNAQKKGTKKTYKSLWLCSLEFTGMTGDKILENRARAR